MRQIKSAGECPDCQGELIIYKTKSYSRFIKCDEDDCDLSYPIPRSGFLELSGVHCPVVKLPILILTKKAQKITYFWVKAPCFTCTKGSSCPPIVELREEYKD